MHASPQIAAQYNAWANKRLNAIGAELSDDYLEQDRGASFRPVPRKHQCQTARPRVE